MAFTFDPLTPWAELQPWLRAALQALRPCREPDVARLVERAAVGGVLDLRVPYRQRPGWGLALTVIIDRSDRLVPYWRDQDAGGA